jgi:hypothetical protein
MLWWDRFFGCVLFTGLLFTLTGTAAAQPHIFYSDLESGPKSGGEKNAGAYVTIYGVRFGATQGSSFVTIGGGRAASYPIWTDTKIAFQLGSEAATGEIVVTTSAGASSPIPFSVRSGAIYFVAANGKNSNNGSFSSPWATLTHARDRVKPGDIVYARNGVAQTTDDGSGWRGCLVLGGVGGKPGAPISFVVYPGESATIGSISDPAKGGCSAGLKNKGQGENYWVIAGFTLRGMHEALAVGYNSNWRVVANDMSCPNGNGQSACFDFGPITNMRAYGNNIHDVGTNNNPGSVTALYHGVYIVDGSSDVDFGWNTVAHVYGGRGIQENSSTKQDAFNLQIHDNVIHDTQCDGIVLVTVDPSKPGGVNVWNNVIYNAGKGPRNAEGSGAWRCIGVGGYSASGTATSGVIEIYNNTMYGCGTFANPPYGGSNGGVAMTGPFPEKRIHLYNNIIYQTTGPASGSPYVVMDDGSGHGCTDGSRCNRIYGSNNLFFGAGPLRGNNQLGNSLSVDPGFVALTHSDFHLGTDSPARKAGSAQGPKTDKDGRPGGGKTGYPIGAYQYTNAL